MSDLYNGLKVYTSEEIAEQIARFENVTIQIEPNHLFIARYDEFYEHPLPRPLDMSRILFRVGLFALVKRVVI